MSAILSHQNKARAATNNPVGRFEKLDLDAEESDRADWPGNHEEDHPRPLKTEFFRDSNKSVLVYNDSPDIGPGVMLNPYRGCEHGCIYCFARPNHEYLGLSAGLDFESKIFVKTDAPALLRKELNAKKWTPQMIALSGVTDCYQPVERKLKLTRQCLEVLAEFKNPVGLITKNHLITRDLDILQDMARWNGAAAYISLTTLDADLQKIMEPRTSPPKARLRAIETLAKAGIPVGVMTAPIIPGLTDHELPDLLKAAAEAGAQTAGYIIVRLSHGLRELFQNWLEQNLPLKKDRVLGRIRDLRGGKLNDTRWGVRKTGEGPYAELIAQTFRQNVKKYGLDKHRAPLSTKHFRPMPEDGQLSLF
ncbi:MAG: PA0069 family radical SAM protein [Alphaproteobacteria bacterium]|nr:PA0069 family radical SAM protein [Alphaproteobacteria bacterium]MBP7757873.1 PA0069 family radical SAM protein [Alphaproteobacteria bacterium]MBP7761200.1 PA0069 family radical SAM protein [Alphaproteobacteria bacterium]MBP7905879.1 PA0069 family radical SAM protein [Alphaproteobacteria bacterium]